MFNKRHIVRTIAATVSILALSFTAACGSGQSTASNSTDSDDITQQTYKPGKLTIATGQPAYEPWVMNDKPESGEGYEAAVAYAVADKLGFKNVMMAMPTTIDKTGVHFTEPAGTEEELASLQKSYEHLCKMRDEIVELGIVPPVAEWKEMNPNL